MTSYFFYYFSGVPGSTPFFEVVNCRDDAQALERCAQLLAVRATDRAEVWLGERRVGEVLQPQRHGAQAA